MKKILAVLCIGFFCVAAVNIHFENTETALANGVIRFHIIANSDSSEDQELKLKVRDRIINEMKPLFDENGDIDKAKITISENMDRIKAVATDEIRKNGYSYDVKVKLGKSVFPSKEYGEIVLPAGSYEALKIEIGEADGRNWWCVLFPPLCFVDESMVSYNSEGAARVIEGVGSRNADLVKKDKTPKVVFKFKSYELWQNSKQKLAYLFGHK